MATDRLAALRSRFYYRRNKEGVTRGWCTPRSALPDRSLTALILFSNPSSGRYAEGGYQSRRPNPYAQQDDGGNQYEMSNYSNNNYRSNNSYGGGGAPAAGDIASELNVELAVPPETYDSLPHQVSAIQDLLKQYNDNVALVSNLHQRALNNIEDKQASQQLDEIVSDNRKLSNELKNRIKALQAQGGDSREGQTRRQQAALLKDKFQSALQNYQQVEQRHRNASKNQMERQFRIVKPNATAEEVRAVVNDEQGGQIFQQALMNSDQFGRARAAYREVQERHNDILKITETVAELQQLMNDMAMMVEEQGETINTIEQTTAIAEKDVETGQEVRHLGTQEEVSLQTINTSPLTNLSLDGFASPSLSLFSSLLPSLLAFKWHKVALEAETQTPSLYLVKCLPRRGANDLSAATLLCVLLENVPIASHTSAATQQAFELNRAKLESQTTVAPKLVS
ncbi:3549_t:CDS:10 [Acaulospora colombiana]|uniref:3549_t:CDS:1 n=1 Tax=Acaulospora colombiana TaxID=27376 RepID=A0ACA9M221_9GLOM|nr:3549_t:CDS:10 [Acaulospora colombiana]